MTIKLMLLKSGEDMIADVNEMSVGEGDDRRVIGYRLEKPCVVKMRNPVPAGEDGIEKRSGFEVSLFPWMPLSAEVNIPVPSDWLVTMVEPVPKLTQMYIEEVLNNGKRVESDQNNSADEQSDTSQSD
tara:strand:- start:375 stop:758 length:384 start_codon:yes stop_codon:yes gene_type:complete